MGETLPAPELPALIEAEHTRFKLPSRPDLIEPTAEYLRQKAVLCGACLVAQGGRLMVALLEALSNSVVHGNLEISSELKERGDEEFVRTLAARAADPVYSCRTVDVSVHYDGESCEWRLSDQGRGFDHAKALQQASNPDPEEMISSGRGLMMMMAFLDEVAYEDGGRRVVLRLNRRHKGGEKRLGARVPMTDSIRVAPMESDGSVSWDDAYEAVGRNISQGGMAILQARLATTDRLLLGIPSGGETLYIPAEIQHMRSVGDGEVELGCRFLRPPCPQTPPDPAPDTTQESAVAELVERLANRSTVISERRVHARLAYTERIEVSVPTDGSVVHGYARDLARGGISFLLTMPMALGPVRLRLPQGPGKPSLTVRARIVRCGKVMEGFYDVAARFTG